MIQDDCCALSGYVIMSWLLFPCLFWVSSLSVQTCLVIKVRVLCSSITAVHPGWLMPDTLSSDRLVLSSVSDYFAAMFTSDVREAKQDEVKMEGVDPDALWVLVQYAYTGTNKCYLLPYLLKIQCHICLKSCLLKKINPQYKPQLCEEMA